MRLGAVLAPLAVGFVVIAAACSPARDLEASDSSTSVLEADVGEALAAGNETKSEPLREAAIVTSTTEPVTAPMTEPVAAPMTEPATGSSPRSLGVVLIDPTIHDVLNVRQLPGAANPIVATLHRTQTQIVPTGTTVFVDGRPWREITVGGVVGWVHGRYVTDTWATSEVERAWDWQSALAAFVEALERGEGLEEMVTWRGFYAVDNGGRRLHWWKPSEVSGLLAANPMVMWDYQGASADDVGPKPFNDLITSSFVNTYRDPDVAFEVRGLPLGSGSVIPSAAVSTAFENFVWVSMHDPGDDTQWEGWDWITWFVYFELDGEIPKVVGVQPQTWGP